MARDRKEGDLAAFALHRREGDIDDDVVAAARRPARRRVPPRHFAAHGTADCLAQGGFDPGVSPPG